MAEKPAFHIAFNEAMDKLQEEYPDSVVFATAADGDMYGVTACIRGGEPELITLVYNLMNQEQTKDMINTAMMISIQMDGEKITKQG